MLEKRIRTVQKVLIIGNGSIATRHAKLLHKDGNEVCIYSHRAGLIVPPFAKLHMDLEDITQFTAAFICTPTNVHLEYAHKLLNLELPLFIEKPLSDTVSSQIKALLKDAKKRGVFVMVGFNLRFLPIIETITQLLRTKKLGKILAAHLYVGQYLPDWRPTKNYEKTYSAKYYEGGGVALDLIHEIDLIHHWFGKINKPYIISHKLSRLKIDTEDYVHITSTQPPAITVTLDTLNNIKTRQYRIIGTLGSFYCDVYRKYALWTTADGHKVEYKKEDHFDIETSFKLEHAFFFDSLRENRADSINERFWGVDALKICVKARKYGVNSVFPSGFVIASVAKQSHGIATATS